MICTFLLFLELWSSWHLKFCFVLFLRDCNFLLLRMASIAGRAYKKGVLTDVMNDFLFSFLQVRPSGCLPMLVFVNSKSGDNQVSNLNI